MTRDGLIEVNETQQTAERISKREQDADFQKSPEQQAAQDGTQLQGVASQTSPLPHAPGASPARDTATAERVMEHIEAAQTRRASKKAVHKAQEEVTVQTTSSRLQFTEEELAVPELECYIEKSNKAADRLDAAKAAIPKQKKLVKERTFDEAAGKAKTRLHFEEQEKPIPGGKKGNPLSRPAQEAGIFVHNKIHSVEKDNSGVEGAHKSEELAERGAKYGARKVKEGYRSHKLKPYRAAAKAEKAAFKANVDFQYHKALHDNPQIAGNPLSRFMQKQQIKRQYAKAARKNGAKTAQKAAENTRKAAKKTAEETKKAAAFVARHPAGVCIAVAALLLFIMVSAGLSSCGSMFSGLMNGIVGTSYTSEDSDLVATENNYAAKENELQQRIDNIERDYPGYDEYRYDLDSIGHNPHELASYLTALFQTYTPQSAQAEINRVFAMQYTLTLTEEIEVRHRTETRTGTRTVTDPETGETSTETYEYEVDVAYNYYILNVKLTNKPVSEIAEELLTPEQLEMYRVYLETSGNKPLIFGGGSPDTGASEDLSGVQLVNGTRPGNTAIVELAKRQAGNVGGRPYWSWYGFNSRVEWCACFVSWCYNQAGKSEPRFAGCQSQGVPWFQSRGQWGARGYENIAPGDAIFFDWDGDGSADHVGLVIGTDGERVYTVEGNSGDACKIKSYPVNYSCIKGYGLMNWN
ncbi:MAG: CD1108 family mobile element protein [[Clostridium] leptum]